MIGSENSVNLDSLTDAEVLMLMSEDCKLNPLTHNKLSARLVAIAHKVRGRTMLAHNYDTVEERPELKLLPGGKN